MITEDQIDDVRGRALRAAVSPSEGRLVLVPLTHADLSGPDVVVPYTADKVHRAPDVEKQDDLTPDIEQRVFEHFGLAATLPADPC